MKIHPRELIIAALFDGWGLVMPVLFHVVGLGAIFLPMFIPMLVMGFFVGPVTACLNALMVPVISSLLTGMPPLYPPLALVMSAEAAALAVTASFLFNVLRWNLWISMLLAIVAERIVLVIAAIWIAPFFTFPSYLLSIGSLMATMPGIILMICIIPLIVKSIHKFHRPVYPHE